MTFTYILFIILYRIYKRTFKFPWNSNKIFNKSIHMDDNRWISWYLSFGLGPFHQPVNEHWLVQLV